MENARFGGGNLIVHFLPISHWTFSNSTFWERTFCSWDLEEPLACNGVSIKSDRAMLSHSVLGGCMWSRTWSTWTLITSWVSPPVTVHSVCFQFTSRRKRISLSCAGWLIWASHPQWIFWASKVPCKFCLMCCIKSGARWSMNHCTCLTLLCSWTANKKNNRFWISSAIERWERSRWQKLNRWPCLFLAVEKNTRVPWAP